MSRTRLERERTSPNFRPEVADVVAELLVEVAGVSSGKMFGHPGFYIAGRLFACAYGDGLGVKLPGDARAARDGDPSIESFSPYGRRMKEWIFIRHPDPEDYRRDKGLLLQSAAYVESGATRPSARGQGQGGTRR